MNDRVGIGWRGALALETLERAAELDVLEVIAEDWLDAPRRDQEALEALAECCPIWLHGVSLGLASSEPVEPRRLARFARLAERAKPEAWSEHLAFVRGGGVEIGHLAAPPRTAATIEGTLRNVAAARLTIGSLPALENVATLIDPPASTLSEASWVGAVIEGAGAPMLLDLHNLYANALNFGLAPPALLAAMPLSAVRVVHIAGGRWVHASSGERRLLDDHLHDVPDPVFELLGTLAGLAPQPLTVIVERDGRFAGFEPLLAEVARARAALARGRASALGEAA